MLKDVIRLIVERELISNKEIANTLGIQKETLDDMLQMLLKKGYLKTNSCDSVQTQTCSSCSHSDYCGVSSSAGTSYLVTEKGKRWIGRDT